MHKQKDSSSNLNLTLQQGHIQIPGVCLAVTTGPLYCNIVHGYIGIGPKKAILVNP